MVEMQNINVFKHYLTGNPRICNTLANTIKAENLFRQSKYWVIPIIRSETMATILNKFLSYKFTKDYTLTE